MHSAQIVAIVTAISVPVVTAILVLGPYGLVFFAMTLALRIPEAATALARVARLRR